MMSVTIPEAGSEAESRQAEKKAKADRLKAMIDRAVQDGSDELFDALREMCWQNDTASGEGSRQNRSLFEENGPSDLQLMVALRSVRAIEAAVCDAPKDVLMSSLISATDLGALVRLAGGVQFSDEVCGLDPLAGPVARTIKHRRSLKDAAGKMLSSGQVEELLGMRHQAIDTRRKSGRLLAVMISSDWCYPTFQFTDGAVEPLMEDVLIAHKEHDPWFVFDVLLAKDDAFGGRSLLDLVRGRETASVARYLSQIRGDGYA